VFLRLGGREVKWGGRRSHLRHGSYTDPGPSTAPVFPEANISSISLRETEIDKVHRNNEQTGVYLVVSNTCLQFWYLRHLKHSMIRIIQRVHQGFRGSTSRSIIYNMCLQWPGIDRGDEADRSRTLDSATLQLAGHGGLGVRGTGTHRIRVGEIIHSVSAARVHICPYWMGGREE